MTTSLGEAVIQVSANVNSVEKEVTEGVEQPIEKSTKAASESTEKMSGSMKSSLLGAVAGFSAFEGVEKGVDFLKDAVSEAATAQTQFNVLDKALENVGHGSEDAKKSAEDYITSLSNASGQTKSDLIPTYTRLVTATGSQSAAQKELNEAMNLAAGTGKSFNMVVRSLITAQGDSTTGMAAYGLQVKNASGTALTFQQIQEEIAKKYGGDWKSAADSASGSYQRLGVEWSNMEEEIGNKLLPTVTKLGNWVLQVGIPQGEKLASTLATKLHPDFLLLEGVLKVVYSDAVSLFGFFENHEGTVKILAEVVGALVGALVLYNTTMEIVEVTTKAFEGAQAALDAVLTASPIGLTVVALAALAAGLVIAYKNSATFREIVNEALHDVEATAEDVAGFFTKDVPAAFHKVEDAGDDVLDWVKSNWPYLVGALGGPFGEAAAVIYKHWDDIEDGAKTALHDVEHVFTDAGDDLIASGEALIKGFATGITKAIDSPYDAAKSVLGKVRNLFPFSPAKEGPFSGHGWTEFSGQSMMQGLAKGFGDSGNAVTKAMDTVLTKLSNQISTAQSKLSTLKSDSSSISSSVVSSYGGTFDTSDTLSAIDTTGGGATDANGNVASAVDTFLANMTTANTNLTELSDSFQTLKTDGLSSSFLSSLYASGNDSLIEQLASGPKSQAKAAQKAYTTQENLATSLGSTVANNQYGKQIKNQTATVNALKNEQTAIKNLQGAVTKVISAQSADQKANAAEASSASKSHAATAHTDALALQKAVDTMNSDLSSSLKSMTKSDTKVKGFASGVTGFSGGLAMVGEYGKELVALPRGSSVVPAPAVAAMAGAAGGQRPIHLEQHYYGPQSGRQALTDLSWALRYAS